MCVLIASPRFDRIGVSLFANRARHYSTCMNTFGTKRSNDNRSTDKMRTFYSLCLLFVSLFAHFHSIYAKINDKIKEAETE